MERYEVHVGKGQRMEKAYGGGMVTKGDMWDNVVTMKGRRYAMESELAKRRQSIGTEGGSENGGPIRRTVQV